MKIVLHILLLALWFDAAGQEPYPVWLTEQQGLPSNTVYQVFHDAKGFTWLATEEGLCRYDGNAFKKYYNNNQTSVSGSDIKQDKLGRIWYQNFDGYCYYVENDSLKSLNQNQPLNYNPTGISNKYIFVLQKQGIDVFDIENLKLIKTVILPKGFINLQHSLYANGLFYFIENYNLYTIGDDLNLIHLTSLGSLSDKKTTNCCTLKQQCCCLY
jgi:ligand-binding sensor domain-containing protein